MEEQSDKLRSLLDDAKFDVTETLLPDLIRHITEDDPYHFFRYVQDLLEYRRIDALLLENEEIWSQARKMYVERFPWLHRHDLKCGPDVPEERERIRRLVKALNKAFKGVPGEDYKEDWITEYLAVNGLSWEDVANGRHIEMQISGTTYMVVRDTATLRLDPKAGIMGLASRAPNKHDVIIVLEDDTSRSEEEEPGQQGPIAKMAIAVEPLTPEDRRESVSVESPSREPDGIPGEGETPKTPKMFVGGLPTPEDSANSSQLVSPLRDFNINAQPSEGSQEPARAPSPKPATGVDWFLGWHKATRNGKVADFQHQPYKGWLISGPVVTLRRVYNFLSDEDIDRTPNWASHVAEIAEYLAYLLVNYDEGKHRWGCELREAIEMLRMHIEYEDYHYATPALTLHFDETPLKSERLPPVKGSGIGTKPQRAVTRDPLAPRNLLHGPPESVWDNMYRIPDGKLRGTFLKELRADEKLYWTMKAPEVPDTRRPAAEWRSKNHDRAIPNERPDGFNMCETEDNTFTACMRQGPLRTYEELKRSCHFKYRADEHREAGDGAKPGRNKQLLQFSKFRGANRAALTLALRTLGSQKREIQAVCSPWRKLVVRTPEQRQKKARPGIIWQSAKLDADQIPKDDFDPMAYNFWHTMMLENQRNWARRKIPEVKAARKTLVGRNEAKYPPVPETNFKGPFTAVDVNEERHTNEKLLGRLERTLRDLETASRLSPRPILADVLVNARLGLQGMPPAMEDVDMLSRDDVDKADGGDKEVRVMKHNDADIELLERMSHVSINDLMLKLVPREWSARKRIFADHVQALVADISTVSIFSSAGKQATLDEVVDAVNTRTNGPVQGAPFTHEEATEYLGDLEAFKRISINRNGAEPTYSRPETTIHPEQTYYWNSASGARPRPAPTYLTYEALVGLSPNIRRVNQATTAPLLKRTAWRLGKTIWHLEQALASDPPTDAQRAALRTTYRDLTRNWERKVETNRDAKGTRHTMDYRDVVRYADPRRFNPEWASDDAQVEDGEDLGPVYAGVLREAHENKTMLWPARWRQVPFAKGLRTLWSRDGVWSWARPDVKRPGGYFHIRRWPVHLQSKELQERIRSSGERRRACAVLRSVKRDSGVSTAATRAGAVMVEQEAETEGVEAMKVDGPAESPTGDRERMDEGE